MSRLVDVEYEVKVYARVDLDEGTVVKVIQDETVTPTGQWSPALNSEPITVVEAREAERIAESDQDWPAWTLGY